MSSDGRISQATRPGGPQRNHREDLLRDLSGDLGSLVPAPRGVAAVVAGLERLHHHHTAGLVGDEEYETRKRLLLQSLDDTAELRALP